MTSTYGTPADVRVNRHTGTLIGYWIATALFCLQIGFTAYAQHRSGFRSRHARMDEHHSEVGDD